MLKFALAASAAALALAAPAGAATVYESATFTGNDTGEYIVSDGGYVGAAFSLASDTAITGVGGQFGGFPGGTIFGAIVQLAEGQTIPSFSPADISTLALGHTVFSVTGGTHDQTAALSLNLAAGNYALVFGSGQFGANGFAGLGGDNDLLAGANLFQSPHTGTWNAFNDGVRVFVNGDALAPVPEPGEWAMLTVGLGAAGYAARRRKRA